MPSRKSTNTIFNEVILKSSKHCLLELLDIQKEKKNQLFPYQPLSPLFFARMVDRPWSSKIFHMKGNSRIHLISVWVTHNRFLQALVSVPVKSSFLTDFFFCPFIIHILIFTNLFIYQFLKQQKDKRLSQFILLFFVFCF